MIILDFCYGLYVQVNTGAHCIMPNFRSALLWYAESVGYGGIYSICSPPGARLTYVATVYFFPNCQGLCGEEI